jgi:hypothetical protein
MNSRDKGKRGELELVHWLEARGIQAIRGQQRKGGSDSPDIMHTIKDVHIEVKRTETLRLWEGLEQAAADCRDRMPTLWFKRNRWQWYVALPAADFVALLKRAEML